VSKTLIVPRDEANLKRKDQRYSEEKENPMQRLYREWEETDDPTPFQQWRERRHSSSASS